MSFKIEIKGNLQTLKEHENKYALIQLNIKQRKAENCKYKPGGNYITYSAQIGQCIKCNKPTGRYIYQSRCGRIYCKTCMNEKRTNDQVISCTKCKIKYEIILWRDKYNVGENVWQCLCFTCFYGLE